MIDADLFKLIEASIAESMENDRIFNCKEGQCQSKAFIAMVNHVRGCRKRKDQALLDEIDT